MGFYDKPLYYNIGFSFRNIKKEVDFFEKCIKRFSKIRVKNILEIACGHSPYLYELNRMGYSFTGLDLGKEMLDYSLKRAKEKGIKIKVIHANMNNFKTKQKFDFVYVMLGSIFVKSNKEFLSHLNCVASCLRRGGLYLIDGIIKFDFPSSNKEEWTIHLKNRKLYLIYKNKTTKLPIPKDELWFVEKNNIKVKVVVKSKVVDKIKQLHREKIVLTVKERGRTRKIVVQDVVKKYTFPQEFLELVQRNGKFEFLGWYPNFDFKPLKIGKGITPRVVAVLRKR